MSNSTLSKQHGVVLAQPVLLTELFGQIADMEVIDPPKTFSGRQLIVGDIDGDMLEHIAVSFASDPSQVEERIREYIYEAVELPSVMKIRKDSQVEYSVCVFEHGVVKDGEAKLEYDPRFDSGETILKKIIGWAKYLSETLMLLEELKELPHIKAQAVLAVSNVANALTTKLFGLTYSSGTLDGNDYAAIAEDSSQLSYVYRGDAYDATGGKLSMFLFLGDATKDIRCEDGRCMRCNGCAEHYQEAE